MKKLFLLFFLLMTFPAFAGSDPALPDKYLGYWPPLSRSLNNFGMEIRKDGLIYDIAHATHKYDSLRAYRFIEESPDGKFAYLIVPSEVLNHRYAEIWQLQVKPDKSFGKKSLTENILIVEMNGCNVDFQMFASFSREQLREKLAAKECLHTQNKSTGGEMSAYIRSIDQ